MRLRTYLTAACTVAVLATACAPASATYKVETARFRVTLSGQQTTSWTLNQSDVCGTVTGSGKQSFTYHQKRAITLAFVHYVGHDGLPWVQLPKSLLGIPITGTASRDGKVSSDTTNPNCRGTPIGPPQAPPAPDCGTKHYDGSFGVAWYTPSDFPALPGEPVPLVNTLVLDEERPQIPFAHCPFNGPIIMQRLAYAQLSDSRVFSARKHLTLRAKAHQNREVATGVRADSTVSWTMQLTRIG